MTRDPKMEVRPMAHIEIAPVKSRVVVRWHGHVVAETHDALELREGSYPPVLYIPRAAADMKHFERTLHHTTCPHKGVASYFTLTDGSESDENAVWSSEIITSSPVRASSGPGSNASTGRWTGSTPNSRAATTAPNRRSRFWAKATKP